MEVDSPTIESRMVLRPIGSPNKLSPAQYRRLSPGSTILDTNLTQPNKDCDETIETKVSKTSAYLTSPFNRKIGLYSGQGRYLTAESFGHKTNVTGTVIKKKQTWTLIPELSDDLTNLGVSKTCNPGLVSFSKCKLLDREYPVFYLRSCMDRFLGMDKHGNLFCDSELAGIEQRFALIFVPDLTISNLDSVVETMSRALAWGSFHVYNVAHGYYLSASADNDDILEGVNKPSCAKEHWSLHLQIHPPYVNIRHVHRGKYIKATAMTMSQTNPNNPTNKFIPNTGACDSTNKVTACHMSHTLPWGIETLFTVEPVCPPINFPWDKLMQQVIPPNSTQNLGTTSPTKISATGNLTMYTIKSHNGLYLTSNGYCQAKQSDNSIPCEAMFFVLAAQGHLAFRDLRGRYLTALGNDGLIKCKNSTFTKDDLWEINGSLPQISLKNLSNDKYISAQRVSDLTVNQDEFTHLETFQLENDASGKHWQFKTSDNKYWAIDDNACILCTDSDKNLRIPSMQPNTEDLAHFDVEWLPNKCIAIKSVRNGKYLTMKINKQLFASATDKSEREMFKLFLLNRPFVFLQSLEGHVGETKNKEGPLDVSKTRCEETYLEQTSHGTFHLKTVSGMYWTVQDSSNFVIAQPRIKLKNKPDTFGIIFIENNKIVIVASNDKFLKIGSGKRLGANEPIKCQATLWNI